MSRFRSNYHGRQVCHQIGMPEVLLKRRAQKRHGHGDRGGQVAPGSPPTLTPGAAQALEALPERILQPLPNLRRKAQEVREDAGVKDAIALLERRLQKLAGALESQESLLLKMRHQEQEDHGVASNFREVQGLPPGHPGAERKQELMRRIFESNQELRERITSLRRLAE